ncbi:MULTISPECIES: hypothetical protein [Amycolatopsis]|uniref:hypothetical protein n=1 Tax=Amycolatopsis TaxID=1813 RepID=UPI00093A457B|nr:hypothetical protein [Amycolatopsis sp. CB00013]OKJ95923.1 hypothetical protein AMK34_23350 [Amycolatopsis sp. CB00013]
MGRPRVFAALSAAVLMLAGCAAAPEPLPSSPLTLHEALGDPTTVDFCGLLDFAEIEKTQRLVSVPMPSMGACSFQTGRTLVSFGFPDDRANERLTGAAPVGEPSLPRGLRVVRTDLQGQPVLHLLFADDTSLRIGTFFESREGAGPDALAVATKTAETAARALAAGKRAKHLDYRGDSLARLTACTAMWSDAEISARLGAAVTGKGDLSRHSCRWGEEDAERLVRLEFGLGPRPKAAAGVREETVGGHRSLVQEAGDGCTILTGHIGGPDASRDQVEHAVLAVRAPDACGVARALAATAWPKLPS